ncbi:hypothetical protein SEA_NHAGOS_63 [Gordonia phage NHagos]|nr:hypothetical protein SEA_NHAGOS_63 [Gordonia phage NHagos]
MIKYGWQHFTGTGVLGYSEGAEVETEVGVIGTKGDNEGKVALLTRFDSTILTPANACRLALRLVTAAAREVVGL